MPNIGELQYDAECVVTLLAGRSGFGKTTLALRNLVADKKLTARFVFDYRGEFGQKLGLPYAETVEELPLAADDGFCLFYPGTTFPGRMEEAFRFFVKWVFDYSFQLPGRKLLVIDEVWKYCNPHKIPEVFAECVQEGRKHGLEMMFLAQRPNRINEAILNEVSELICFCIQGDNALECVEEMGADRAEVENLQPGQYIAINTKSGRELRGSLWGQKYKKACK